MRNLSLHLGEHTKEQIGIRRKFDKESPTYVKNRPWLKTYVRLRVVKTVENTIRNPGIGTFDGFTLVAGTGPGWLENSLQDNRFISLDISKEMATLSKSRNRNVEAIVANAEQLPFRPQGISNIIASRVIKFLDVPSFLTEAERTLKNDGKLALIYDSGDIFWVEVMERIGAIVDPGLYRRTLRTTDLKSALGEARFAAERAGILTAYPLSIVGRLHGPILRLAELLDRSWLGGRLSYIVAKKRFP